MNRTRFYYLDLLRFFFIIARGVRLVLGKVGVKM